MKLRKENPTNTRFKKARFLLFDELEMNSILGDEKAVLERDISPWVNPDKDRQTQFNLKTGHVVYFAMTQQYSKANELLKQLNKDYPQVGDYRWLNNPLFDRIKKEYPQFQETINQIRLPPKLTDSNPSKM